MSEEVAAAQRRAIEAIRRHGARSLPAGDATSHAAPTSLSLPQAAGQEPKSRRHTTPPNISNVRRQASPSPALRRAKSSPAVVKSHWQRLGLHVDTETAPLLAEAPTWLPSVSVGRDKRTRRASIVIVRQSRTHRHRTVVSFDPNLLRFLVLFMAVGAASALSLGGAPAIHRAGRVSRAAIPTMSIESHSHVASHLRAPSETSWAIAKLVSTDVRKLAGQLKDTVAVSTWSAEEGGVSVFDALGAAALHLDEYATTRAPILQWSSAKCLSGLGVGPAGGAVPSLGECLSPLTRDVTPLLGKCLVHSPWRVCRLAMRYVAFVWTRALASAAGQPEEWARKKGQLLANLLEEVDGVLNFDTPEAENPLAALGDVVRGCMRTVATAFNGGAVDESDLTTCRMRSNAAGA